MSKYDDAAGDAAAETDAELFGKLQELAAPQHDLIRELIPEADHDYVWELCKAVEGHTDNNKISNAWVNFAAKASDVAIGAMRKIVLGI